MQICLPFATPAARWAALQTRNPEAAKAFVYCVTTTKIYCRPTCPSRLARRANILFQDTASEAEAEGFRACKRCRPELKDGEGDPQKIAVEKACCLVREEQRGGEDGKWSVKALATEVGLTESHFCRIFKKIMGMTVGEYRASIVPRPTEGLVEGLATDQQSLDYTLGQTEFCLTPDAAGDDASNYYLRSAGPELTDHWNCFSSMLSYFPDTSYVPQRDPNLINPESISTNYYSDAINLDITDDGLQFLDSEGEFVHDVYSE